MQARDVLKLKIAGYAIYSISRHYAWRNEVFVKLSDNQQCINIQFPQ